MTNHLDLLLGVVLVASPLLGLPPCSSDGQIALYHACNLTRIPQVPSSTERLLLSFNAIGMVTSDSFPFLGRLWLLEIGAQETPLSVDKDAFRNLPNLKVLDLGKTPLGFLHPDAFQGLPRLSELRLFGCGLSSAVLTGGHFRHLESLARLDLSSNEIQNLSLHPSFRGLDALTSLDFSHNQIEVVCEPELRPLQGKALSFLSLASNPLYIRVSVDWGACGNPLRNMTLETLDLSHNSWSVARVRNFSQAIRGSLVSSLLLSQHIMGPGFGFQNLQEPDQTTFAGLAGSSVKLLDLSGGYIFSLNPRLFEALWELKVLNLAHNKINKIADGTFQGLQNLQLLNMSYNLLGELYNSDFSGLSRVAYIDLQNNHIGIVQHQTFSLLKHLQTLDLQNNALKTISFLPSIDMVLLGGNKLTALPSNVQLTANFLQLSENKLEHLADLYFLLQIPRLQVLIVNQNRLSFCDPELSPSKNPSLEKLFLSENMLQLAWESQACWDMFRGLPGLQLLFLNNNYLSFLPPQVFSHLTALRVLSLHANRLTALSPGDLPASLEVLDVSRNQLLTPDPAVFSSLRFLDVTHNKFICECELGAFVTWLNCTNVTLLGPPQDRYCVYPHWLEGVPLADLSVDCDDEEVLRALRFVLFSFLTVSLTLFLGTTLIVARFRGHCFVCYQKAQGLLFRDAGRAAEASGYRYDAYLCFSARDFEWVQSALLRHLDAQYSPRNRLRLCFEERDFVPGENHLANIQDAVWCSRKTVCVVSRHFLRDGWCLEAFSYAQSKCVSDLSSALVVLVVGSLSQYQLMKHQALREFVRKRQYLRWPEDLQDVSWFLSKLSQHILKREKSRRTGEAQRREDSGVELHAVATPS
ncbi:toll-like receptor 5 [Erinaceus europaeus]|uniref:Toll-like receptor 5 n=1 Tax=Erinaceus europaeus TaxID=9365 RepID=A0A1S3A6T1_ERIEU|nr:toll-like receptor 5 [Erinaceus europaeus]XP_060048431.1 toll-like receptor 5 [Erinaceus europaeus]